MKSKSRFFTADSFEAAKTMATQHFECGEDQLVIEDISGSDDKPPVLIYAFLGTRGVLSNIDAGYSLVYEPDGVYLELYPERGTGTPLDRHELARYLGRKNISMLNDGAVQSLVLNHSGRSKIATAQQEYFYGEDIVVEIAKDDMEAYAMLLAPEPGGGSLEFEAARQKLLQADILYGIDEQALRELLYLKDYNENRTVAMATVPVDGVDGELIYHFSTEAKIARPKELEDGKVDYRSLDLYVPVEEGQLLVSRTLATEGTLGMTVKGREMKQRHGKSVNLPKGKNVHMNLDKTEMYANNAGMVEFINGQVNVSNVYKIDGDVDLGVGNIDFDGSVHINGNVRAGHVIKATGGVVVGGVVEASEIYAGGNVEVKRGMQGMDKGLIEASGSISLLYIERGKAVAGGSITVDASIHSTIEAGVSLYAKGKRGSIIGGHATAAEEIVANSIGSISHVNTEVEVGVMAQKRKRMTFLEKEMERLSGEMVKLDQLDAYLKKSKEKLDAETYDKLYRSGAENRRVYTESMQDYNVEINTLTVELDSAVSGKVHVYDTAYEGARITIASQVFKVNDDIKYATFKYKDEEVIYVPCEKKKG